MQWGRASGGGRVDPSTGTLGRRSALGRQQQRHPSPSPSPPPSLCLRATYFKVCTVWFSATLTRSNDEQRRPDPRPPTSLSCTCHLHLAGHLATWTVPWACRRGGAAFIPRTPRATLGAPACAIAVAIAIGGLMTLDERIKNAKKTPADKPPLPVHHILRNPVFDASCRSSGSRGRGRSWGGRGWPLGAGVVGV